MGGDNLDPLATDGEGSDPLLTDQEPAYEDDGYSDSDSAFALSPSSPYYPLPRAATPPPPPPLPDVLANRARLAGLRAEADGLENDRAQAVASNKRALAISKRSEYKDAVRRLRVVEREVGQEVWRAWRGDEDVLRGEVNVSDLGEDEAVERVEEALVRVLEVPRDVAEEGEAVERAESGGVSGGNYCASFSSFNSSSGADGFGGFSDETGEREEEDVCDEWACYGFFDGGEGAACESEGVYAEDAACCCSGPNAEVRYAL